MAGLAVTTSALSLPRLGEQGWGIIVTSHFLSDVTVQGHKRGSFPSCPGGAKQPNSPWYIPCAWRPQSASPFPFHSLSRTWLCDYSCFAQTLGEFQPAAEQGWKRCSKNLTLAGVQDFPAASVPVSKAASPAPTLRVHKARCQRWPWGQGDTSPMHPSTPQAAPSPGCPQTRVFPT